MAVENVDFYSMLDWFEGVGGFDIVLPFLLIFAITFAILQKVGLFGDDAKAKKVNVIVSAVIGLFLVMQGGIVEIIQGFLPRVSMIMVVVLMFLLLLGIFGGGADWTKHFLGIAAIFAVIAVLWAVGYSLGWSVPLWDWFTEKDISVLIVIGIFVLVIWLIVKEPKKQGQGGLWKGLLDGLGKFGDEIKKQTKGQG